MHIFSNLGKAPYTFLNVRENAHKNGDGTTKGGGKCSHCGTGLRWEYRLKSADNKIFVVGSDCIKKADDTSLLKVVKNQSKEKSKQRYREAQDKKLEAKLEAERELNGGFTDSEFYEASQENLKRHKRNVRREVISMVSDIANQINNDELLKGRVPNERGVSKICSTLAALKGKKATTAYLAEFNRVKSILDKASEMHKVYRGFFL